jgi:REP element-mobilizing transposase RayT
MRRMLNDPGSVPMDDPLAFFLTWTTYGTWLPGDSRGWVNKPGDSCEPEPSRERGAAKRMTEPALTLDVPQRRIIEDTIAAHCRIRGWHLHAVNARTQHVHVVVTAPGRDPEVVMDQFKAWCTRKLKEREQSLGIAATSVRQNWWTQRGSKRYINNNDDLCAAIQYVVEEQGEPTPRT